MSLAPTAPNPVGDTFYDVVAKAEGDTTRYRSDYVASPRALAYSGGLRSYGFLYGMRRLGSWRIL